MDELAAIVQNTFAGLEEMKQKKEQQLKIMRAILWGPEGEENEENVAYFANAEVDSNKETPAKKRVKRLSALEEDEAEIKSPAAEITSTSLRRSPRKKTRASPTVVEATSTTSHEDDIAQAMEAASVPVVIKSAASLMPPPAAPVAALISDQSFARPQRAAKLNCEKHLKEPKLNSKLRRGADGEIEIKLEHEQRASQMHEQNTKKKSENKAKSNTSIARTASQDSIVVIPNKTPPIVTISDTDESIAVGELQKSQSTVSTVTTATATTVCQTREVSVRIKREKLSEIGTNAIKTQTNTQETTTVIEASVLSSTATVSNTTNDINQTKKGRKKKVMPIPIKVERLSENDSNNTSPPIATRTRSGSNNSFEQNKHEATPTEQQNATVYEEAVENQEPKMSEEPIPANDANTPIVNGKMIITQQKFDSMETVGGGAASSGTPSNATMVLGAAPNDATYCTAAASTFIVDNQNQQMVGGTAAAVCNDITFDVASASKDGTESQRSSEQSMATARDTLKPRDESLITEDESDEGTPIAKPPTASKKANLKLNTLPFSASKKTAVPPKSYKMPVREIFNPLIQSPVKKKVEAFESVAAANKNTRNPRSRLAKENSTPNAASTTPLIGKTGNRYLTHSTVVTPNTGTIPKKLTASASKAITLAKSISAGNLRSTASAKAPLREHSADDIRRGNQLSLEDRKNKREHRHMQAAHLREAKERERAERLAKAAKEREEKRLKKQQQADQQNRELLEIQRNLKEQEEARAAANAAEAAAQKAKLMKISQQQNSASKSAKARMLPPQPKSKYTFEMLHEDDSTDDEGKVTYKRPPPPTWSLTHVRGPAILAQEHMPTVPIDCFFSVQPRTLDLQTIFPKIDPRYLKRNSSAIWQTPPRYSELPKY